MLSYIPLLALAATSVLGRKCHDFKVPVSIEAENGVFDIDTPYTAVDVDNFFLNLAQQGRQWPSEIQKGTKTIKGKYELAATYCEPDSGPGKELQILTHGVGFDRRYWDLAHNNHNYSYVAKAVDHGYSTLTWDRLGVGASSKGDPLNEIQVFLEVAALRALTIAARKSTLSCTKAKFERVVHAGHSFGAVMTYTLAREDPDLSDAIVLQGFTQVSNYLPLFLMANNFGPVKDSKLLAKKYPKGYVTTASASSVQLNFFAPGDFDPEVLQVAYEEGQPTTPGEMLTVGAPAANVSSFAGPVLVLTGEHDLPFCGGDCYATSSVDNKYKSLLEVSKDFFPNATSFNATVVPGAGHGLNYAYSHTVTYSAMLDFFAESS